MPRRKQLVAITICMMIISMQMACIKRVANEDTRITLTGVNKTYIETFTLYSSLLYNTSLPAEQRAALFIQMSKPLDDLRDAMLLVDKAQISWDASKIKPADFDTLKAKFDAKNLVCKSIMSVIQSQSMGGAK
jgi:hypothetical protein